MSGEGAPGPDSLDIEAGLRVAIVAGTWHADIQEALVANALAACQRAGAQATVVRVPGAFELPVVAQAAAAQADAVVALGTIIRGGTPHFDYVCDAVTSGLTRVALDTGVPVGFGILTCDDDEQARERAGLPGSSENKGAEAAEAALATATSLRRMGAPSP